MANRQTPVIDLGSWIVMANILTGMPAWPGAVLWSSSRAVRRPSSKWPLLRLSLRISAVNAMWISLDFWKFLGTQIRSTYSNAQMNSSSFLLELGECLDLRCVGKHDYQSKVWRLLVSPKPALWRMPGRLSKPLGSRGRIRSVFWLGVISSWASNRPPAYRYSLKANEYITKIPHSPRSSSWSETCALWRTNIPQNHGCLSFVDQVGFRMLLYDNLYYLYVHHFPSMAFSHPYVILDPPRLAMCLGSNMFEAFPLALWIHPLVFWWCFKYGHLMSSSSFYIIL